MTSTAAAAATAPTIVAAPSICAATTAGVVPNKPSSPKPSSPKPSSPKSSSPRPSSSSVMKSKIASEIPTHTLYNLALLDPPKYGWCAAGGIIEITEPHERARRKSSEQEFVIAHRKREREEKRQKEKEVAEEKKRLKLQKEREEKQKRQIEKKLLAEEREKKKQEGKDKERNAEYSSVDENSNVNSNVNVCMDESKAGHDTGNDNLALEPMNLDADSAISTTVGTAAEIINSDPFAEEMRSQSENPQVESEVEDIANFLANLASSNTKAPENAATDSVIGITAAADTESKGNDTANVSVPLSAPDLSSNSADPPSTIAKSPSSNKATKNKMTKTPPISSTAAAVTATDTNPDNAVTDATNSLTPLEKQTNSNQESILPTSSLVQTATKDKATKQSVSNVASATDTAAISTSSTISSNNNKSLSTSTIKTRNQGQKIPSTSGIKKKKKKRRFESIEFRALIKEDEEEGGQSSHGLDVGEKLNNDEGIKKEQNLWKKAEYDIVKKEQQGAKPNDTKEISTEVSAEENKEAIDTTGVSARKDTIASNSNSIKTDTKTSTNAIDDTREIAPKTKRSKLNPFIYHRGEDGSEMRNKITGALLCPVEATDTNHNWDEPNLKFKVKVCFPLVDTDELFFSDDENEIGYGASKDEDLPALDHSPRTLTSNVNAIVSSLSTNLDDNQGQIESHQSLDKTIKSSPFALTRAATPIAPVRRNARRGNQVKMKKKFETIQQRRLKREAKIKALPHFNGAVEWDLSNPNLRTPLIYASDIAVEYGLSLNQTLDLARSIQEQIDEHVRTNVKYKIPISAYDPLLNPRKGGTLHPPEYHFPKILYGGHGATNINPGKKGSSIKEFDEDDEDEGSTADESEKQHAPKSNTSATNKSNIPAAGRSKKSSCNKNSNPRKSSSSGNTGGGCGGGGGTSGTSSNSRRKSTASTAQIKYTRRPFEVVAKDELPCHDVDSFYVDKNYVEEILERLMNESRVKVKASIGKMGEEGELLGKPYTVRNHNCHICHTRKPECVIFPCGNARHAYCDYHCSTRLGFRLKDYAENNLDYCPVCCLQCICSKCNKGVGGVSLSFKKECDSQGKSPKEAVLDDCFALKDGSQPSSSRPKPSRPKPNVVKRAKPVKHAPPKPKQRPPPRTPVIPSEVKSVVKVPATEFPSEVCDGENYDPSLENDYRTVFTPEGPILSTLPVQSAETVLEEKNNSEVPTDNEDGNVDFCLLCKESGDMLCCDKCPRAFHDTCLKVDRSRLPDRWECPRCEEDCSEQPEDLITDEGNTFFDSIVRAYRSLENGENIDGEVSFFEKIHILCIIKGILKRLIEYDFGYIFKDPVSTKEVPDYRKVVKKPMDLGTISSNLSKGAYTKRLPLRKSKECTPIDTIVLEVLKDIELVWHNCLLYNREGTSYYRMAKVMREKYYVMRRLNFDKELSPYISQQLGMFVDECKQSREENAKHKMKKSWIPFSKNEFKVSAIQRGVKKAVAVLDPRTNMVVKQYTSMQSAAQAAMLILNLGFSCEINPFSSGVLKANLHKSANDPSILIFGYRWLFMEDLRKGRFKVSEKRKTMIRKLCTASNAVMQDFETIEEAHEDWLEVKKYRVSLPPAVDGESLEFFKEKFLDGNEEIDGFSWHQITGAEVENESTSAVKMEVPEEDNKPVKCKIDDVKQSPSGTQDQEVFRAQKNTGTSNAIEDSSA